MEFLLLEIFAFLRPVTLMGVGQGILGLRFFDLAGVALIGALALSMFIHMGLGRKVQLTAIDQVIILYVLWCIALSIIYPEKTQVRELIKWISAFLTYTVVKHVFETHKEYAKIIFLLLLGLSIPIILSSIMIYLDVPSALNKQYYATKLKLYQGAYANPANMAYSAFLYVALGFLYYLVVKEYPLKNDYRLRKAGIIAYLSVIPFAVYCLIHSASRTAIVGLVIFLSAYLYKAAKRYLIVLIIALVGVIIVSAASVKILFMDIVEVYEGERPAERIASGRPFMWAHNLSEYSKLSIDRQIAGAGIGNKIKVHTYSLKGESFWPSHNDFLAVFIHTGIIGFTLFVVLQIALLKKVLALEGGEKTFFLAFFLATAAMNFASNSFVSHFGLSQIYFMVIAYIEAMPRQVRRQREVNGVNSKAPVLNRNAL